jgi:uncharacterized protein (TIGR00730 family)
MYKSLAVFCGSKSGANPLYKSHTLSLGKMMADNNIKLIYGGGSVGLMGAIADSVMQNGGEVIGIIPEILLAWEQQHKSITELIVVTDMHVRKKMMYDLCDAAIILPGGNGTLDELFEMLTWNTLKIHSKKIFLLNSDGYYNHLILHINNMLQAGFLYEDWQERLIVCDSPEAIFDFLDANIL